MVLTGLNGTTGKEREIMGLFLPQPTREVYLLIKLDHAYCCGIGSRKVSCTRAAQALIAFRNMEHEVQSCLFFFPKRDIVFYGGETDDSSRL